MLAHSGAETLNVRPPWTDTGPKVQAAEQPAPGLPPEDGMVWRSPRTARRVEVVASAQGHHTSYTRRVGQLPASALCADND